MYVVYEIKCNPNSRSYFGRSQEVEKRWRSHRNMLRSKSHSNVALQQDWIKYGECSFSFTILHEFNSLEESLSCEQNYIDETRGNSYNISNSTNGGDTFTYNPRREEIRALHSKLSSGENNPMYGRVKSDYIIKRIKEANSKPVRIQGVTYPSLTQASIVLGVKNSTVNYRLNSDSNRFKDWVYVDREMPNDYRKHAE